MCDRDYKDICYFIDHTTNVKFRKSLIEQLGYKIGVDVKRKGCKPKDVIIGKRNEKRVQISEAVDNYPLVMCAIIENGHVKKQ